MKIQVKLAASENTSHTVFELDDFDITEPEWDRLSYWQKMELIKKQVFALPEQPYWCLDDFSEI